MKIIRTVAALALVVALGACSKSSTTNESPSPSEAAATTAPAASAAAATTVKVADSKVVTDASSGMSLYTFDNDTTGKSNCDGTCAQTWPPMTFSGSGKPTGADNLDVITRADGSKQVTWNGKPLYHYSGDTAAGDTKGDGLFGKWHVAKAM